MLISFLTLVAIFIILASFLYLNTRETSAEKRSLRKLWRLWR